MALGTLSAITLTALLAGCTASRDETSQHQRKDRAQWVLPLDEFSVYNGGLAAYAEELPVSECMRAVGYDWPVPWRDPKFAEPADFNQVGRRLFDERTASTWGYHLAPPENVQEMQNWAEAGKVVNSNTSLPGFGADHDRCVAQLERKANLQAVENQNYISGLTLQASDVAEQDAAVLDAVEKWKKCLSPQVDFALPAQPWREMPPLELSDRFGLDGPNATDAASAEEIAIAKSDAQCRESSGLSQAFYDAEWKAQLPLVEKNRDKLESIRSDAAALNKKNLEYVAAHGPKS